MKTTKVTQYIILEDDYPSLRVDLLELAENHNMEDYFIFIGDTDVSNIIINNTDGAIADLEHILYNGFTPLNIDAIRELIELMRETNTVSRNINLEYGTVV